MTFERSAIVPAALVASCLSMPTAARAYCEKDLIVKDEISVLTASASIYPNADGTLHWEIRNSGPREVNIFYGLEDEVTFKFVGGIPHHATMPGQKFSGKFTGLNRGHRYMFSGTDSTLMAKGTSDHAYIDVCFAKNPASLP